MNRCIEHWSELGESEDLEAQMEAFEEPLEAGAGTEEQAAVVADRQLAD